METLTYRIRIPVPAEFLYAWHAKPGAFKRLAPPWEEVTLLSSHPGLSEGSQVSFRVPLAGPIKKTWVAEHRNVEPGRGFQDAQVRGPFAHWVHTHSMNPVSETECELVDHIEYRLPLGAAGRLLGGGMIRRMMDRTFQYRHAVTTADCVAHFKQHTSHKDNPTMKILVSGLSGLVGSELGPFLTTGGHEVFGLTRSPEGDRQIRWDIENEELDASQLEGFDAVVHLAGENIAKRWNEKQKRRIRESRVKGTTLLCERLASLESPPKTLVCASAIGFYGDRGDEVLIEDSPPGEGFLPEVCQEWEAACQSAREKGIRVVNLRLGVVLSPKDGALKKMLLPFKMGAGGKLGDGKQWMSWIAIDDVVGAIHHCLTTETLSGPVNAMTPNAVTNLEFTKALGRVLKRPTILPMPGFAAKLAFGEMADALLLSSCHAKPSKLVESGYEFRCGEIEPALRHLLGR